MLTDNVFRLGHRLHLDGLRGIAIALVFFHHAFNKSLPGSGYVGVVIFFVLSGFLITSLLLEEWREYQNIDLKKFFIRRALRLLPALFAMVVIFALWATFALDGDARKTAWLSALLAVTYTVPVAYSFIDITGPMKPMWTLATEEWFYLTWPLALRGLLRRASTASKLIAVITTAIGISTIARMFAFQKFSYDIYTYPSTWVDSLLVGALIAVIFHFNLAKSDLHVLTALLAWTVICFMSYSAGTRTAFWSYSIGLSLLTVATAGLIAMTLQWPENWSVRFLKLPLLRWLGARSYGLYLWNGLYFLAPVKWSGSPIAHASLGIAFSLIAAELSWQLIEKPALRLKARYE